MSQLATILSKDIFPTIKIERIRQSRIQEIQEIFFHQPFPETIKAVGLSFQEEWGRWSLHDTVVIEFQNMLPLYFRVTLEAISFSQKDAPFTITIGDISQNFTLDDGQFIRKTFIFRVDHQDQSSLKITIPNPVSPKSLGYGDDTRTIGIGLRSLRIEPLEVVQ